MTYYAQAEDPGKQWSEIKEAYLEDLHPISNAFTKGGAHSIEFKDKGLFYEIYCDTCQQWVKVQSQSKPYCLQVAKNTHIRDILGLDLCIKWVEQEIKRGNRNFVFPLDCGKRN